MANTANLLTLLRLALGPVIFACLLDLELNRNLAALLTLVAAATDALDGMVARRLGQQSSFGAVLDETTDKIFLSCLLIPLTVRGELMSVTVVLVLCGWFAVTAVRQAALLVGKPVHANVATKIGGMSVFIGLFSQIYFGAFGDWFCWFGIVVAAAGTLTVTKSSGEFRQALLRLLRVYP